MFNVVKHLWKLRESEVNQRIRHLESQLAVALDRIKELEEHAVTKQFKRGQL